MVRFPLLCDVFHKEERKKFNKIEIEKDDQDAIMFLRQYKVDETNAQSFIENLVQTIHSLLDDKTKRLYSNKVITVSYDSLLKTPEYQR